MFPKLIPSEQPGGWRIDFLFLASVKAGSGPLHPWCQLGCGICGKLFLRTLPKLRQPRRCDSCLLYGRMTRGVGNAGLSGVNTCVRSQWPPSRDSSNGHRNTFLSNATGPLLPSTWRDLLRRNCWRRLARGSPRLSNRMRRLPIRCRWNSDRILALTLAIGSARQAPD